MQQSGLGEFGDDRPAEEARAVAGDGHGGGQAVVDLEDHRFPDADDELVLAVTQVDYTLVGSGRDERPVIHVFGRTADNELEHVRVHGFRPYFYTPTDSLTDEKLDRASITGTENGFTSIRGEDLTRVYARTPRDVGEIRDAFEHYEADILFPNRFRIDKGITSGIRVPARRADDGAIDVPHDEVEAADADADLRVNTFDIEVDDRSGFPEDGEEPILCLTSHDSYENEYVVWHYVAPEGDGVSPTELPDHELLEDATVEVRGFDAETEMLHAFLTYVEETDPDVMTGWNFADFDAPYLLDRMGRLDAETEHDLDPDRLSRIDEVWRSDWQGPNVKGRVVFDLLYGYKRTQFSELDSYRLDAVAEVELGVGKERYAGDIGDLWEQDPARLLEYNLRDVELCVEIDRKQGIIPFWEEVASFVGCALEDATTPGDAVDMYVLHKAHGKFALPSKGSQSGEEFEGGAVFDPITGVREMVAVLDLASLYPMAMVTMNASPETKVGPGFEGETYTAPNGQRFRKEPDGIMREMVDELLTEREQKKFQRDDHEPDTEAYTRYDQQQAAVKVIMNCFTPDTEVLTPDGVRDLTDLEVGDEVYSLDPETMAMEVKPVVETHAYPDYDGELVDIGTSKIDFRVTPNHRMLVRKNDKNGITEEKWSFVQAGELYEYCNYEMPHSWSYQHPATLGDRIDLIELIQQTTETDVVLSDGGTKLAARYGIPNIRRKIDTDTFLEFLAWYITEGNVYRADTANYQIKIAQNDEENRNRIVSLVESFVDSYYTSERCVRFNSRPLAEFLDRVCGHGSANKRIPNLVFDASAEQKEHFLQTLVSGDGRWEKRDNSFIFSTKSRGLRDDFLRLCAELGITAHYTHDSGVWRVRVSFNSKNSFRKYRSADQSQAQNGVYCVSVEDNNTLLAGRNGKFQFVGNSLYGVSGWERFRLYDRENAAAVTATGREVIEFTEEAANEIDREVIYGDTDSVMLDLSNVLEDARDSDVDVSEERREAHPDLSDEELQALEVAINRSFQIEDHINSRYDDFAKEELNAEFHRFQIEFEKLYRRFFQAGKKKRYAGHIIWKEGNDVDDIDITGFEYKRSDIAPITKRVQREVIEMIVRGRSKDAVSDYVHDVIEEFEKGELSLDDIGVPSGIGKRLDEYDTDTAHVRGAKYANLLLGTNFQRGSKPKRLYLEKVHPAFFRAFEDEHPNIDENPLYLEFKRNPDVICFEYADQVPEEFHVDWEKMLEKTLRGPIARVLEALDISWDEVKSGQEQTGLESYM